jgi:hypothetical protein
MSVTVNVNGVAISYPQTGDSEWGDEATDFAIQTGSALGKIGLSTGTSVDITSTLDVTGATTLDSTLTVAGTTTLNGTANLNGNTNLGNATSDTIAVTGILNVDSGTLYVNPTDNKVGINDSTPSEALDVTGNALISGTLGVTGNVITSIVKASGSGGLTIDSNGGTDVALFGAGGGSGTTLYGGLNGTTATMSGVIFNSDGTATNPSIAFTSDTNTGLYRIGSDKIGIATNGARVGEIGVDYGGFTGNIIQVLQTSIDTQLSTSSTSYVDITGLSVSITPKYSTSKILIRFKINGSNNATSNLNAYQIVRGSTAVGNGAVGSRRFCHSAVRGSIGDANSSFVASGEFLDSPSTTSATTYKMQFLVDGGTGYINRDDTNGNSTSYPSPLSSITVMEVQQ